MELRRDQSHEKRTPVGAGSQTVVLYSWGDTRADTEAALSLVPTALLSPHLPRKIPNLDFLFMLLQKATQPMRLALLPVYGLPSSGHFPNHLAAYFHVLCLSFPSYSKLSPYSLLASHGHSPQGTDEALSVHVSKTVFTSFPRSSASCFALESLQEALLRLCPP